MKVLVFNCGSSSLKYKIIRMPEEIELLKGEAQRIGPKTALPSRIVNRINGEETVITVPMSNHKTAFEQVMKILKANPQINPDVIGHRMVHGGSFFSQPTPVTDGIFAALEKTKILAPIHNPPAIELIDACRELEPDIPQILVFDTAYHATIPDYAYYYAIPLKLQDQYKIRKYGFHGTSHHYVVKEAARYLDIPVHELNAVSCHLGSGGASLCAVKNGKSIDNTMGYSPLQGLIMSTRCGDIDPGLVLTLLSMNDYDPAKLEKVLNQKSGVIGLSGRSSDIRDSLPEKKDSPVDFSKLNHTLQTYIWRIKKYLGAYLTVCSPVRAVILTDTVGEEVPLIRALILDRFDYFGIKLDQMANQANDHFPLDLSLPDSKVKILAIKTNEELEIARNCYSLSNNKEEQII